MQSRNYLYEFFFLAGFFGAIYLYAFHFDDFSETELVHVSYAWIAALAFGAHGLIAADVKALLDAGEAKTLQEAIKARGKQENRSFLSRLASLFLPSYLLVISLFNMQKPLLVALAGTAGWILLLFVFLEGIFPGL